MNWTVVTVLCVWRVLQQTLEDFEVRCCCASPRLHQARRGVQSCVQAAAADRIAGGRDIVQSAEYRDGVSVLCHLIADANCVNQRSWEWLPPAPLCPIIYFHHFHAASLLHCITLLGKANLKFAVFCFSATLMWMRRTASNCRPLSLLLFLWSETLFAQVDSFAFLQSIHSTAFVCLAWPSWIYPSFGRVESWRRCEGQVLQPSPLTIFHSLSALQRR
jgi:hypothetical protein